MTSIKEQFTFISLGPRWVKTHSFHSLPHDEVSVLPVQSFENHQMPSQWIGCITRQDTNLIQMTEKKVHLIAATVILSQDIQPFIWLVNKLTKFRRTNKDWGVGIDIRRPGQCLMPHIHPPSHYLKHAVISLKIVETQTSLTDTCAMKPRGCLVWLEKTIQDHVFVYHMNCLMSHYHMIYCTSIGLAFVVFCQSKNTWMKAPPHDDPLNKQRHIFSPWPWSGLIGTSWQI